jgi:hypothetical protein
MIISIWCVFSKLLRPSWISKYIVKIGCNSVTFECKGHWLFCHHRRTTRLWWSRRPSPPLFVWCSRGQYCITAESFSNPTPTTGSLQVDRIAAQRWPCPMIRRFIRWSDGDVRLDTGGSCSNVMEWGSNHGQSISHAAVLVHTHTRGLCSNVTEVRTLSWTDDKQIWWCSVHPSRSQISTVMAMSITAHSLPPRPKLNCDVGYDAAMKGASVVVAHDSLLECWQL